MGIMKKVVAVLLTGTLAAGCLMGCASSEVTTEAEATDTTAALSEETKEETVEEEKTENVDQEIYKICVFTLKSSGQMNAAVEGFLSSISEELGFTYEVRYKGDDGSEFLSKVETAISEGFQGIITMKDEGNTNEIVALCEENGVYYGNIWNNQGSSLNASSGGYAFLNSPYFVGGLTDCEDSMATEAALFCEAVAKAYYELPEDKREGSIGFVTMPPAWQPTQVPAVQSMYEMLMASEVDAGYAIPASAFATNGITTRTEEERFAGKPVAAGTYVWPSMDITSKKLESKYFDSNPNMTLLISTLAYSFINPALDTAGKLDKVKVWCTGFDNEAALVNNFGTSGSQTYQGCRTAPVEAVAMPLVQILDKLAGNSYSDKEELLKGFAEITDENKFDLKSLQLNSSAVIVIQSDEELDAYLNHNVYGTALGSDSLIDAATLKTLMATYNSDATYAELLSAFGPKSEYLNMEKVIEHTTK